MSSGKGNVASMLALTPVVPVLTIDRVEHAVPLAECLQRAGVPLLEITLRTEAALPAIEQIAARCPGVVIAAGTVTTPAQLRSVADAGAQLAISPGATSVLYEAAQQLGLPFLPGVATASELIAGLAAGLSHFKLFPASVVGGLAWLRAMGGPFAEAAFCPTGGISRAEVPDYLAEPNVRCVGASWLASRSQISQADWSGIEASAKACVGALVGK
ncbi:MAG: bifunctional 4-hydroxy-2-oxoglutarate aldolase/2-dehydro-3-deoxy-phosphogluconate aldolase [Xanthomonadales bacterium]|nr:bifunctional 4-hydroxy-2-oxoglutarate aldolase/2-dehydro-3-deoxy-phosphogluconate aldolase [Xanthomonadales bacterium]